MYEYNNDGREQMVAAQAAAEQARINAQNAKKANRRKFWAKVGTGAVVGLAFGVVTACSYVGVTRAIDYFFPKAKAAVVEEKIEEEKHDVARESEPKEVVKEEKAKKEEVKSLPDDFRPSQGMDVSDIVEASMPSIVSITNKSVQEIMSMWGMGVQQYESKSAGSGIVIGKTDDEILIVSNNHVVAKADTLSVGFVDDEIYSAYVKGTEPDLDLAVIAVKVSDVKEETLDAIKTAEIGDSDKLRVGEQVIAIGNALGYGQSVTTGIVSALERDITEDNVDNPLIQTDAAINPGNSGGALFDREGKLVGINCAKLASTEIEGVGYAIPISAAQPIIESLMTRAVREEVDAKDAGYIGISGVSVDAKTSQAYGIPQGVYIQSVEEDSPAEKAGISKSDVIKKFDGITVSSIADIREQLNYYKAGEEVDLLVYRMVDGEYKEKNIKITLGSREGTPLDSDMTTEEANDETTSDGEETEEKSDDEGGSSKDGNSYYFEGDLNDLFREFFNR